MNHLTPDELIDAMEDMLEAERRAHLSTCDECQRQLADLSATLSDAKEARMPEPSPLFWTHFSRRVNIAIDAEPVDQNAWPAWLRWQVLLPLGAMAMVILALASTMKTGEVSMAVIDPPAVDSAVADDSWTAVATLVGDMDIETASAAGVIAPGIAEQAILELTTEEQQELTRLLKVELQRAKS